MERYEYLRARKRCVRCQERDERTMSGKCLCKACAKKVSDRTPEAIERSREYMRNRRNRLKAAGLCVACGRVPVSGQVRCEACAAMNRVYMKRSRNNAAAGF